MELIYQTAPRYNLPAIVGVIGGLMVFNLLFIILFPEIGWFMALTAALELGLFYIIIPRRYQILTDRMRVVLGRPVKFDLPFSTIREARPANAASAFVYWGLRMATSGQGVVEIIRRGGGLDMVISPLDRDIFLEQLNQAMLSAGKQAAPPKWRVV